MTYSARRQLFYREVQDIGTTRSRALRIRNIRKDKEQNREEESHC